MAVFMEVVDSLRTIIFKGLSPIKFYAGMGHPRQLLWDN